MNRFTSARLVPVLFLTALATKAGDAAAQTLAPQYGGTLEVGSVYTTLPVLSWDLADWNWKQAFDTGQVYEQLFVGDLSKARHRGGTHAFTADGWLPPDAVRGELAESWLWKDKPLRVEIKLRKGIMFPARPGVMAARELTAADVVFSYTRQAGSPKKLPDYFDHIAKVEAKDRHTVVFHFNTYNAEWDYRYGWGIYGGIVPKEVVDAGAGSWKNLNGTGPFQIADHIQGAATTFVRNAGYWDKDLLNGQPYKLPFIDRLVMRSIKDESTQHALLRSGKLDILEAVRWSAVDELKKSAPRLRWHRWLSTSGTFLSMRVDTKPFNDIRVRRALNMAVNKQEIVKAYYGGNAEILAYPMQPDYVGYYEPLDAMPASVKELFVYNPDKARKLLAEAGYPNGFSFKVQVCGCAPDHLDLLPLVAGYLAKVGVQLEIQTMEYGAFLSAMTSKTLAPGYFMNSGAVNPTTTLRKTFYTALPWNTSQYSDPEMDKRIDASLAERDEKKRQALLKALNREILDTAPHIWLPSPYIYSAWWPWVRNYGGELRASAFRPGPIYARIWIDQELKRKMGY